jgi:hypothetical protein
MVVLSEGVTGGLGKTQADFYVTVDLTAINRSNTNTYGAPVKQ